MGFDEIQLDCDEDVALPTPKAELPSSSTIDGDAAKAEAGKAGDQATQSEAASTKTLLEPLPAKKKTARKMMKGKTDDAKQQDAQPQEKVRRTPG